jgi:hypothetical protein
VEQGWCVSEYGGRVKKGKGIENRRKEKGKEWRKRLSYFRGYYA